MYRRTILWVGVLLAITLTACASGNSDETATTPELPTLAASRTPTAVPTSTNTPTQTPQPTATSPVMATAGPTAEPNLTMVPVDPALAVPETDPPLNITLPEGWRSFNGTQAYNDVDGSVQVIPYTVYFGPVTGGLGQIILMWGFPSLAPFNPIDANAASPNLWLDGMRLLRVALFDPNCNIGTDVERNFRIGGLSAPGTAYSVVDCPDDIPPIRGWFAGVQQQSINFVFYTGTEPIEAMDGPAQEEIQAILDTVEFRVEEWLLTPQP